MSRSRATANARQARDPAASRVRREDPQARRSGQPDFSGREPLPNHALAQALGAGVPLDPSVRAEMEQRFGTSFAEVRIHDDQRAHRGAGELRAQAYTHGSDIAFGASRFAPQEASGRRLLAHELAHVLQQRRRGAELPRTGGPLEREADRAAQQATAGTGPVTVSGASAVAVARQPLPEEEVPEGPVPPRSLTESLAKDEKSLGHRALDAEMALIEDYLEAFPTPPEQGHLIAEYKALYAERLARRKKVTPQMPAWMQPEEVQQDVQDAHRAWRVTGEIPQTRFPFSWGEIKLGKPMTRSERYDLMLQLQGKEHPVTADLAEDQRDPELLTKEEFKEEFWKRRNREWEACEDEYFWPKYERQCQTKVDYKYGGPAYQAYREEIYRRTYIEYLRVKAGIESVKYGGPVSLAGRVAGYAYGAATGEDPLAMSEKFATVASVGDILAPYKSVRSARSRMQNYSASGGLEVRRDVPLSTPAAPLGPASALSLAPDLPRSVARAAAPAPLQSAPIPIASGKGLPQSAASQALEANLARQSPAKTGSITPLRPPRSEVQPPPTEPAQQAVPAYEAVQHKLAVGQTHAPATAGAGKPKLAAVRGGADPDVASRKPSGGKPSIGAGAPGGPATAGAAKTTGKSRPAKPGAAKPAASPDPERAGGKPGAGKKAAAKRAAAKPATAAAKEIEARLQALDVPAEQRAAFNAAANAVRKAKNPAAAERLLQGLEQRFGGTASSQVRQEFEAAQKQLYPEKGKDSRYRQSPAADERAELDQAWPGGKAVQKAKVRESERRGTAGGLAQAAKEGITVKDWNTPQQWKGEFGKGPDALGERGNKRLILENKGGGSRLGKSGPTGKEVTEMSNEWAGKKIAELEIVGDRATAAELLKAAREGNLQGVVYRTRELKSGEKTTRLKGHQLRDHLPNEKITESGLIEYSPTKVERAYEQHKKALEADLASGKLRGRLKNL